MLLLSNKHFQIFLVRASLFVVNIFAVYLLPVQISWGLYKSWLKKSRGGGRSDFCLGCPDRNILKSNQCIYLWVSHTLALKSFYVFLIFFLLFLIYIIKFFCEQQIKEIISIKRRGQETKERQEDREY
jgi:hypothetical protein